MTNFDDWLLFILIRPRWAKARRAVLFFGVGIVGACSNADIDTRQQVDSSLNLLSAPANVLRVYTLDLPWDCTQNEEKVSRGELYRSMLDALLLMQHAQCANLKRNRATLDSACVTVVVHADPTEDATHNLIGYIPLYFSENNTARAEKKLVELAKLPPAADSTAVVVESALGSCSIAAYLHQIKHTTPVIVLLPMTLPSKKLTPELYKAAFNISE